LTELLRLKIKWSSIDLLLSRLILYIRLGLWRLINVTARLK